MGTETVEGGAKGKAALRELSRAVPPGRDVAVRELEETARLVAGLLEGLAESGTVVDLDGELTELKHGQNSTSM